MKQLAFVAAICLLAAAGCRDRDTVIIERDGGRPQHHHQPVCPPPAPKPCPPPIIVTPPPQPQRPIIDIDIHNHSRCDAHNHCGKCPHCHSNGWYIAIGSFK